MGKLIIPENYRSCLSSYETQEAIGMIKILMQKKLCMALKLKRVTAPLFVDPASGLNDDLIFRMHIWKPRLYILLQNGSVWHFIIMIFL